MKIGRVNKHLHGLQFSIRKPVESVSCSFADNLFLKWHFTFAKVDSPSDKLFWKESCDKSANSIFVLSHPEFSRKGISNIVI